MTEELIGGSAALFAEACGRVAYIKGPIDPLVDGRLFDEQFVIVD